MATVIPSAKMVRRLLPLVLVEGFVAIACVLMFVQTEQLLWIGILAAVTVATVTVIVLQLARHRDEWRWQHEPSRTGRKNEA